MLDSVLWFHLECPKWVQKFDEPEHFKGKFREYFSELRQMKQEDEDFQKHFHQAQEAKKLHIRYPQSIRQVQKVKEFSEDFFEHRPDHHVDRDEDIDALVPEYDEKDKRLYPNY